MVFSSTNQTCHRRSNPWALSWKVSLFVAASVVRDFGLCGEPWTRFFGEERSLDVPLKLSLVAPLSCFSVPDLHYVHCTRVVDSCAHIITLRLASGQKLGPNWLRFEVFLIFAQSEWTRSWNTRVYSTNSSLSVWGMTHADWPKEVIGRTGRVSERRRFITGGPCARESPLAASRVVLDDDLGIVEGLTTKMRKSASILILLLRRSLRVGSNVLGGRCPVLVVGPGVKISSSWKQERG